MIIVIDDSAMKVIACCEFAVVTKSKFLHDKRQCGFRTSPVHLISNENPIIMKLVENLGNTDRTIRILISAVIVFLFAAEFIGGLLATVLLALGAVLVATAFVGFCPLYSLLGLGGRRKRRRL